MTSVDDNNEQMDLIIEEARRTHDHYLELIKDMSNNALELVKINLLVASALLVVFRFRSSAVGELNFIYLAFMMIIVSLSVLTSFLAFVWINPILGFDQEGIRELENEEKDPRDFLHIVYTKWTQENYDRLQLARRLMVGSIALSMAGLGAGLGILMPTL